MENLEEDFTPDFTYLTTAGEICGRGSLIRQVGDATYISVNNRLNMWNIRFSEIVETICSLNKKITCFDRDDNTLVIGYENGVVQIHSDRVVTFRPHSKRVVRVVKKGDCVISGAMDGSIVLYDMVSEDIRVYYEGNTTCVEDVVVVSCLVIAVCSDNSLRVWDMEDRDLKSVHIFEKPIKRIVVESGMCIVFFKDGECVLYDLVERTSRHIVKFKKLRNVKREDRKVFIQCKNKLHVYEIWGKEKMVFRSLETIGTSDRYMDFDVAPGWGFIFITSDNCWETIREGKICSFGYHKNEILDFEVQNNEVVTFSKEHVMFWTLEDEKMRRVGSIQIKNGECMCIWNGSVVVGGSFGLSFYSLLSYDLVKEMDVGAVSCISTNGDELGVGRDNVLFLYNKNYEAARSLETEELISSIGMAGGSRIFCVGLLNSKIYIYDSDTLALKVVLYGHALPVRSMGLSPDDQELLTCGTDKVVKMWGTRFGECRKTFIGDARNVEYLNSQLFMFASDKIQYFRRYEKLREFKRHQSSVVKVRGDLMISCGKFNIDVYRMDKYEFQESSSSEEEDEVLRAAKIVNYKKYDEFLVGLEKLGEEFSDDNARSFFNILAEVDFCELDKFLYLLNSFDVGQVMNVLDRCSSRNMILAARVLMAIARLHKEVCVSHTRFEHILKTITEKVVEVRNQIGMNEGRLLVGRSSSNNDIDEELMSTI